jgi:hypothetical protein
VSEQPLAHDCRPRAPFDQPPPPKAVPGPYTQPLPLAPPSIPDPLPHYFSTTLHCLKRPPAPPSSSFFPHAPFIPCKELERQPVRYRPSTSCSLQATGGPPPRQICARSAATAAASTVSTASKPSLANGPCPSPSPNTPSTVGPDTGHQSALEHRHRRQATPLKRLPPPCRRSDRMLSPRHKALGRQAARNCSQVFNF